LARYGVIGIITLPIQSPTITEFTARLPRADVSQTSFARLTGVTVHQQNNWTGGLAPKWAGPLSVALQEFSQEALAIALDEAEFSRREISASRPTLTRRRRGDDDPHQCRIRKRATRHGHEELTGPSNAKTTNGSA
jgi:hypothetical protein